MDSWILFRNKVRIIAVQEFKSVECEDNFVDFVRVYGYSISGICSPGGVVNPQYYKNVLEFLLENVLKERLAFWRYKDWILHHHITNRLVVHSKWDNFWQNYMLLQHPFSTDLIFFSFNCFLNRKFRSQKRDLALLKTSGKIQRNSCSLGKNVRSTLRQIAILFSKNRVVQKGRIYDTRISYK